MSEVAKHFFKKLTAYQSSERYTANQALNHPWITRDFFSIPPLTMDENL